MGVTAAVTVGAMLISHTETRKREKRVAKAQEEARNVERAERASQATQARRQQVREARIRRAEVMNKAGAGGQTESSAAIAAGDSLQNQFATNVGTIGTALATGEAKGIAQQNIFDANRKSNMEIISGYAAQAGMSYMGKK